MLYLTGLLIAVSARKNSLVSRDTILAFVLLRHQFLNIYDSDLPDRSSRPHHTLSLSYEEFL